MKIPFGLNVERGRMLAPTEVSNGLSCGCVCAGCSRPLIARQGKVKEWHFAHASGDDCPGGVETAIHRMAKQLILDRSAIYLPSYKVARRIRGLTWQSILEEKIQAEGLIELRNCAEEQRVGERQPDIIATLPDGERLAIEVAFSHFCDEEKITWIKDNNLTTLEINIHLPPETKSSEVADVLDHRLFHCADYSSWLHHSRAREAHQRLDQKEAVLRAQHAAADEKQKRKDDFLESIQEVAWVTYKLTSGLTLRIARSKARVTMKGHGYFPALPIYLKQLVTDAGQRFGGRFNEKYRLWEFWPKEDQIYRLYRELCKFIEQGMHAKPQVPEKEAKRIEPRPSTAVRFNLTEFEAEDFDERAGILEFEYGCSREEAEQNALAEVLALREKRKSERMPS